MRFQTWLTAQTQSVAPAAPPLPVASTGLTAAAIGGYFVQAGAYGDRSRADSLANALGASVDSVGAVFRVRLGPYFDESMALVALARVQGQGYQDARLIRPTATN